MKSVEVTIKGQSPLLMHRYPMEPVEALEKKTAEEQAEIAAYRDAATQQLYLPGVALQRGLVVAATFSKGKGRSSLQKSVAAGVFVSPEVISCGTKEYTIDARRVVVPATRGAVVRYRPKLEKWECSFELQFDPVLITENQLRKVVDDCGSRVGVLDFRPAKNGPFGRFYVTGWKV